MPVMKKNYLKNCLHFCKISTITVLLQNTPEDAKIMSWWDYGYQITAMANRTILVDNNTWNNTHISRVGQAMASDEAHAYEIMKELDVDYVLVIFGGLIGYSSDGKFHFFLVLFLFIIICKVQIK